jgi:hypothetical protein
LLYIITIIVLQVNNCFTNLVQNQTLIDDLFKEKLGLSSTMHF